MPNRTGPNNVASRLGSTARGVARSFPTAEAHLRYALNVANRSVGGAAAGPAEVTLTASANSGSTLSTYTFSTQSLGAAATDRKIVITIAGTHATSGNSVQTVTVAGNSATLVKAQPDQGESSMRTEIWQVDVPTGTTGDVVVRWSAAYYDCGIGVFRVVGAAAAAHDTAGDNANPASATIDTLADGVLIGCGQDSSGGAALSVWTNLTERFDAVYGVNVSHTGASEDTASDEVGRSIQCDPAGSNTRNAMALASWGPA